MEHDQVDLFTFFRQAALTFLGGRGNINRRGSPLSQRRMFATAATCGRTFRRRRYVSVLQKQYERFILNQVKRVQEIDWVEHGLFFVFCRRRECPTANTARVRVLPREMLPCT